MKGKFVTVLKFQKKPVEIEAIQFTGGKSNALEILDWVEENKGKAAWTFPVESKDDYSPEWEESFQIHVTHGYVDVPIGWWVIKHPNGVFGTCSNDIFAMTYEGTN